MRETEEEKVAKRRRADWQSRDTLSKQDKYLESLYENAPTYLRGEIQALFVTLPWKFGDHEGHISYTNTELIEEGFGNFADHPLYTERELQIMWRNKCKEEARLRKEFERERRKELRGKFVHELKVRFSEAIRNLFPDKGEEGGFKLGDVPT